MRRLVPLLVLSAALVGCGSSASSPSSHSASTPAESSPAGDIPDNQAYVRYAPPGGGFSVKVPEGWARSTAGGTVTFTDKLNSIGMRAMPAHAPLTPSEARRANPRARVTVVRRPAGKATRVVYEANGRPDPVTGRTRRDVVERYVFFKSGRRVILDLAGPKGADNVDPWKLVTSSLRFG
ncbi:MAG: hypothetical protein QOE65_2927 [Solirubrobacteraceae bacterium]|jgi:hypothetical protein|nr:hypothetical protein [Solirubrobacteraceae bacterium]